VDILADLNAGGNYTVVFYGRGEKLDGFRGLLDTPAEEAYERCVEAE
jgi:hypothetical protein